MAALFHNPLALFITQAALIIVASRLLGLGARAISQPLVVAEVTAGILLGPSLLGWLAPGPHGVLFPAASLPLLGLTSQVGLILFMFLIGLELDPKLLKGRAHTSVAISHSSIVLPFALGAALAFGIGDIVSSPDVPFTSFLLFMGAAMSITAFPVLARILTERRLLRSRVGAIAIACAAVDDVTAWCILAFVVSTVRSSDVGGAVFTTLLAIAYMAFMVFVIRPLLHKLADRTKVGLSQNVVAVIVVMLFASSWITEQIGIHALFGAFLFGAILPKAGTFAHALAEKLEDVVVVVLLPLFFAYSGLRTQIGLLDTPGSWAICGLIIVVACAGKFGGSVVAARITGMSWRESSAIGILMNTRGLMELIVLNIGLDLGVISPTLFTMMVIMALVTTVMTTPLLQWVYPMQEFSKVLAEPTSTPAPSSRPGYAALACVAFEQSGPGLVTIASAIAGKGKDPNSRVYALRIVRATERASFVLSQQGEVQPEEPLRDVVLGPVLERAKALDVTVRPLSFVSSKPAEDICQVAAAKQADIVLLGWHKPVFGGAMLSGVVHEVMADVKADVGVLVDRGLESTKRILVPYLGSVHDRRALAIARRIGENTGARITVLHVVVPEREVGSLGAQERVEETFREGDAHRHYDVLFKVVPKETPSEAVIEESARGYDLVLVGLGREWGLEHRSFGLQREAILANAATSVLAVRSGAALAQEAPAPGLAEAVASPS